MIITSHLAGRAIAYEWIVNSLRKRGYRVMLLHISDSDSDFEKFILETKVNYRRVEYSGKGKFDMALGCFKIFWQILKFRPDVVHTHYFDANLLGLTAAKIAFVPKRIYTRHTTTQRYRYLQGTRNFEKYFNNISTDIVSISKVVTKVLTDIENVPENKIQMIHHGFDLARFTNIEPERIENVRKRYNIAKGRMVIGAISRFDEWKGVEYTINAFKEFIKINPNALLVLANADGIRKEEINSLLSELPEDSYRKIPYENDVFALIKTFSYFVHVPIDEEIEAFGQVYIEVMAAGVPMICTLSGVACEYIINKKNALVVDYKNANDIYKALIELTDNINLGNEIAKNAQKDIAQFALDNMINGIEILYQKK